MKNAKKKFLVVTISYAEPVERADVQGALARVRGDSADGAAVIVKADIKRAHKAGDIFAPAASAPAPAPATTPAKGKPRKAKGDKAADAPAAKAS